VVCLASCDAVSVLDLFVQPDRFFKLRSAMAHSSLTRRHVGLAEFVGDLFKERQRLVVGVVFQLKR
jgi:hypothetical protein